MNNTQRLAPLSLIAATLAAVFPLHDAKAAPVVAQSVAQSEVRVVVHSVVHAVVQLEPVLMTAQRVPAGRAAVVQLPRVEVFAKRIDVRGLPVVQLPAVEVSGRRAGDATGMLAQQRPTAARVRNLTPV